MPKNLTHLLAPLDLTVNKSLRTLEGREFSKYYSDSIANSLRQNPTAPIEDAKVDVRLSVIKPIHVATMKKAYQFFCSSKGQAIISSGFRAAGIQEAVNKARAESIANLVDPFAALSLF